VNKRSVFISSSPWYRIGGVSSKSGNNRSTVGSVETRRRWRPEGEGWTGTGHQSVNYRLPQSSAFFNMTPPLSSYSDGDDDGCGAGGGSQQRNSASGPM